MVGGRKVRGGTILIMKNEINYLGSNLVVQINKEEFIEEGTGHFLLEKFYGLLEDNDVITINEINPTSNKLDYLLMDAEIVFFLYPENIQDLKEFGRTCLVNEGTLENFIDSSIPSHIEFLEWLGWTKEEIDNLVNP